MMSNLIAIVRNVVLSWVLSSSFFVCYAEHFNEKNSIVAQYLSKQKLIRILLDDDVHNQIASFNLMGRLQRIGFTGTFEVIYPDAITHELIYLFDLQINKINERYQSVRFTAMSDYINRLKNKAPSVVKVGLGLNGGLNRDPCDLADPDHSKLDRNDILCKNIANFMLVDHYIWLSPFVIDSDFSRMSRIAMESKLPLYPMKIFSFDNQQSVYHESRWETFFVTSIPTFSIAKEHFAVSVHNKLERHKATSTFNNFIELMETQKVNVLPIDAPPLRGAVNKSYPGNYFPSNLLQIIAGARYAILNDNELQKKPLIIAVLRRDQGEVKVLTRLISSDPWEDCEGLRYEVEGAPEARAVIRTLELNTPNVFQAASILSSKTNEIIKNLQPGQILLLFIDHLPKIMMDALLTFQAPNILLPIREDGNAFNNLIQTGKPHVRCAYANRGYPTLNEFKWEIGYNDIDDLKLKQRLKTFYEADNGFCHNMELWQKDPKVYQELGQLIIDARHSDSALSIYFEKLRQKSLDPENDRIFRALKKVAEMT